ncbi:MAG TPA: SDR family oxidoreductase [Flavobacteriales bacterium]|nr:SDR family oxidoreductase [Flavobacteriales bacterium]
MKKALVTGSNGLLGQKLIYNLLGKGNYVIHAIGKGQNRIAKKDGYTYHDIDFTDKEAIQQLINEVKPDVVINSGAMTNVDACEKDKEGAWKANVLAVEYMVETLEKLKTPTYHPHFIQISTDFVFDGENGPYKETDEPNPLSYYAKSKLAGEQAVMNSTLPWSIARTIIIYGVVDGNQRSNLVLWVRNALANGQSINVITDQHRSPTLSEDLAEGVVQIAERGATGIYHLSGPETKSIWDLSVMIADFWKLDKSLMKPVTSAQLNQPAKRPPVTGFILDKAKADLGYNPRPFLEGLKFVDEQLRISNF